VRHFYRCADCLSVVATEAKIQPVQIPPGWAYSYGDCAACGGAIEYLGQVHRDQLQRTELRVPCDSRCTGATGPHCSCQCGGENHGSNRVVEVVVETGKAPQVLVPADAKVKAETYRALVHAVRTAHNARFGRLFEAKRNGAYLNTGDWFEYREGQLLNGRILEARQLRSHAVRNKRLNAILAELNASEVGVCA
jgi:hypothetical protein